MSIHTLIPEAITQELEWATEVIVARDGSEQRIANRTYPRQHVTLEYLADSHEEISYWKYQMAQAGNALWFVPLWHEAELTTAAITAGVDNTVSGDFSYMDDELANNGILLHRDGVTSETFSIGAKNDATITRASGTFTNSYPAGSMFVPYETCFLAPGSGYDPEKINAAMFSLNFMCRDYRHLDAYGAAALTTYNGKNVLDRHPAQDGAGEQFEFNEERLDYGGVVELFSRQAVAKIISSRSYVSAGKPDRQWWKSFLDAAVGQQKTFYASTYRHNMVVTEQPSVGGSTFKVDDQVSVAGGWEDITSHLHLAIATSDGDIQYREINPATTLDNGDGTHTVGLTSGLTATTAGSTILKVSFLELVRLASDKVTIEHRRTNRLVSLALKSVQA